VFSDELPYLLDDLGPDDFYDAGLRRMWHAVGELHREGHVIDVVTIGDFLRRNGSEFDAARALSMMSNSLRPGDDHVAVILRHSVARQVMTLCREGLQSAMDLADPYELADRVSTGLSSIDVPIVVGNRAARTLDDIVASAEDLSPWVVPGLLRQDWRAVIVAGEGRGKSTLLRQIAACAAQGVHPLRHTPTSPISVLIVDLENPAAAIAETGGRLIDQLRVSVRDYEPARLRVLMRPGGIDLRTRHDRAELERELALQRPQLVVIGPAYKMLHRREQSRGSESYEEATDPVLRVLDDLRTRYSFAVLIEHHAPQGYGSSREMRPYGSQRWLAWPEIGIGLRPDGDDMLLTRWRGDRMAADWPTHIRRNQVWPWTGIWNTPKGEF